MKLTVPTGVMEIVVEPASWRTVRVAVAVPALKVMLPVRAVFFVLALTLMSGRLALTPV